MTLTRRQGSRPSAQSVASLHPLAAEHAVPKRLCSAAIMRIAGLPELIDKKENGVAVLDMELKRRCTE